MTNTQELFDEMVREARLEVSRGVTSRQVYKRAKEQEREGFTVSAIYTRLLASIIEEMGY